MSKLLASGRALFHTNDLALLWGITNRHTLHVAIHRYLKKGALIPVYRGLYATRPLESINPRLIGVSVIHGYTYLSCERVLADEGIIPQQIVGFTFVAEKSRTITLGSMVFRYRSMQPRYLFHPAGIVTDAAGVRIASIPRAIADLLYYNPSYTFDLRESIDWMTVKAIQQEVGYL